MGGIRNWMAAMLRQPRAASAGHAPSGTSVFLDAGVIGTILLGLLSVAITWFGAWYIASEDAKRTEAAAYQDTANLARAFEEHIIRLIQAHDQILLFARASIAKDPNGFDLAQWARDQQLATGITLQIATTDKAGILTASNLGMPAAPMDL